MGFPSIAATASTASANTDPLVVTYPSGIVAGNLLIVSYCGDNNVPAINGAGWTELYNAGAVSGPLYIAYRVADGGEGATFNLDRSSAGGNCSAAVWRITDYTGVPEIATVATGTSAAPNSSSLTPSWGAFDTLWMSIYGINGGGTFTVNTYPSNYSLGQLAGGAGRTAGAGRALNAASEDPGAFGLSASNDWKAQTLAIKGIANPSGWYGQFDIPDFRTLQVAT